MSQTIFNSTANFTEAEQGSVSKTEKLVERFIITSLLLVLVFMCISLVTPLGCQEIIPYYRDVNVTPLMDLIIPADFDLSRWTNEEASFQAISGNDVFTNVERLPSIADAYEMFNSRCEYTYNPHVRYGGQGNNQYCISSIKTVRNDPEGLCLPQGSYSSYVIIQKGNVIIEIYEDSADRNSRQKDATIAQLATELHQAIGK